MTFNCKLLQVSKMNKLLKVIKVTSLKIYISPSIRKLETLIFRHQVKLIKKFPLGAPPQELVTSLPHKYVILANVGCKNNFLIEVNRTLLHYG